MARCLLSSRGLAACPSKTKTRQISRLTHTRWRFTHTHTQTHTHSRATALRLSGSSLRSRRSRSKYSRTLAQAAQPRRRHMRSSSCGWRRLRLCMRVKHAKLVRRRARRLRQLRLLDRACMRVKQVTLHLQLLRLFCQRATASQHTHTHTRHRFSAARVRRAPLWAFRGGGKQSVFPASARRGPNFVLVPPLRLIRRCILLLLRR